jgi:hypothetical protein
LGAARVDGAGTEGIEVGLRRIEAVKNNFQIVWNIQNYLYICRTKI